MSRAFTKEIDDAPPPPPMERPISTAPNLVTPRGAELIEHELQRIETALGETDDKDQVDALRRDQRYWQARRASMQLITPPENPETVQFATRVTLERNGKPMTIEIVGEDEADPAAHKIAWTAPIARVIDGAEIGELLSFSGQDLEIIEIHPL